MDSAVIVSNEQTIECPPFYAGKIKRIHKIGFYVRPLPPASPCTHIHSTRFVFSPSWASSPCFANSHCPGFTVYTCEWSRTAMDCHNSETGLSTSMIHSRTREPQNRTIFKFVVYRDNVVCFPYRRSVLLSEGKLLRRWSVLCFWCFWCWNVSCCLIWVENVNS